MTPDAEASARDAPPPRGRLTIVGTGIRLAGQITLESLSAIEKAEKVFYLVASPAAGVWLRRIAPDAVSLHGLYDAGRPREETYESMVCLVMDAVRAGHRVCAVFYGHPGVGVDPAHEAMRRARHEGFRVRMLPGVSAEACLFADVGFDPLAQGCQSYEATDFVQRLPAVATGAALILWQIGIIGEHCARFSHEAHLPGVARLVETLARLYPLEHEVVAYEASAYPTIKPLIDRRPLRDLAAGRLSPITTLLVPPLPA